MERLDAPTLENCQISEEEAVRHAAVAVEWLLAQLHLLPDEYLGRISPNRTALTHRFFKDQRSPGWFANPEELAQYISKV
jgi:hypothetical protein